MSKTKAWIGAMRLRTLPLSFSVILAGNAITFPFIHNGECFGTGYARKFSWSVLLLTLLTTLLLQVLSNLANDYGDALKGADNTGRIGPTRAIQSGEISAKQMMNGIIVTSILTFLSGLFLLFEAFNEAGIFFITFLILGVAAIAAAIKYTVGKGAYGYSGLGDIFVFLFFGFLGVIGSFLIQVFPYLFKVHIFWPVIFLSLMMGALSTAVLNLNNMRDQINDKAVGKNTIVVKMGFKAAKIYHYVLFLLFWIPLFAFLVMTFENKLHYYVLLIPSLLILIIHIIHLRKVAKINDPKDFDPELKKIAITSFLFSIALFVSFFLFVNR